MNKTKFIYPNIELLELSISDIISTSSGVFMYDENGEIKEYKSGSDYKILF